MSGFKPRDISLQDYFTPSYATPTLHVIGLNDVVVSHERSKELIDVSSDARVVVHDGGHFIPSKTSWRQFFREYFMDPAAGDKIEMPIEVPEHLTPSPSAPTSGIVTPAEIMKQSGPEIDGQGDGGVSRL